MSVRQAPRRRGLVEWVLALIAIGLLAAGCGSRRDHAELVAATSSDEVAPGDRDAGGSDDDQSGELIVGSSELTDVGSTDGGTTGGTGGGSTGGTTGGTAGGSTGGDSSAAASCPRRLSQLTIGTVGELSGVIGGILGGGVKTMQAWVADLNARGGLHCHPVRYVIADSQADPARQQAQVQKLVEEDKVVAFVHMISPIAGQASVDYITRRGIPVVGNEDAEFWFYESPMYFPQMSSGDEMLRGIFAAGGYVAQSEGVHKLAATSCLEVPLCSRFYALAPVEAPKNGMQLVYNAQVTIVAPDYTSNCQAAQRAGAEIMLAGVDPNSVLRMARSCASVNYSPHYLVGSPIAIPLLLEDPRLEGTSAASTTIPFFDTSNPVVADFHAVLGTYAAGVQPDVNGMAAWTSAKLFEEAAKSIDDPPTSANILEGLWSIKDNDLGGITQPLTFTKGQNAPRVFCYWLMQIRDGEYVSPDGSKRTCR